MKNTYHRIRGWLARRLRLEEATWRGIGTGLYASGVGVLGWLFVALAVPMPALGRTLGVLAGVAVTLVAALAVYLLFRGVRALPRALLWRTTLAVIAVALPFSVTLGVQAGLLLCAYVMLSAAVLGGSIGALCQGRGGWWAKGGCTAGVLAYIALIGWYASSGWLPDPDRGPPWRPQNAEPLLKLANPATPGPYPVERLTYGSGFDRHRPEFAEAANWTAPTVDGAKLLEGWDGWAGWLRTQYWGIDAKTLPLQGRVWAPSGSGPFPIVLMVHGNHSMEDFSDTGYAYLGELFASRGIIAVSVDENFFNSSYLDLLGGADGGLEAENRARGWLLLEHLKAWRNWHQTPDHRFYGRVDLDRVALLGHSRGGEAVAAAAVFNRLPHYPDDATLAFDYDFGLRGIIAIAPVDGQYRPRQRRTVVRDVSYLVMHGSHDGDVFYYAGSATYSRLKFAQCGNCFKMGMYVRGANHGQFNTSWGRDDAGLPWGQFLNLAPIMDPEAQRQVAKVVFSAFLAVVLQGRDDYREFLAQPARGQHWLGAAGYVNQYRDARERVLADYEEDDDVTTGSAAGVVLAGVGLTRWQERQVELKRNHLDSAAVMLGWDRRGAGDDAEHEANSAAVAAVRERGPGMVAAPVTPSYRIGFGPGRDWTPDTVLSFALAMSEKPPTPKSHRDAARDEKFATPDEIDFSLVLTDTAGQAAVLTLSQYQPLFRQIHFNTMKPPLPTARKSREAVLQRYGIALRDWLAANPALDIANLESLTMRFDHTPAGTIVLDDVAVATRVP